jgi:hypothetical protein
MIWMIIENPSLNLLIVKMGRKKMRKPLVRALAMFLMAAVLMLYGAPVFAGDDQMTDAEVDFLVQQHLPEGVTLEQATPQQIGEIISKSVASRPDAAVQIAARTAVRAPNHAAVIAASAATVVPHQASDIAHAVSRAVPGQATAIRNRVEEAVSQQRQKTAADVLERRAGQTGQAPPARDDSPASPVK